MNLLKEFLLKTSVRFMHIFGVIVLSGLLITEFLFYQNV